MMSSLVVESCSSSEFNFGKLASSVNNLVLNVYCLKVRSCLTWLFSFCKANMSNLSLSTSFFSILACWVPCFFSAVKSTIAPLPAL